MGKSLKKNLLAAGAVVGAIALTAFPNFSPGQEVIRVC